MRAGLYIFKHSDIVNGDDDVLLLRIFSSFEGREKRVDASARA